MNSSVTSASVDGSGPAHSAPEPDCSGPEPDAAGTAAGWLRVALDVPLRGLFDYRGRADQAPVGSRVIVPFGSRKMIGVVVEHPLNPDTPEDQVRDVEQYLPDTAPLPDAWLRMTAFAARYYQRPLGEVMLPSLPASLRKVSAYQGKRSAEGPVARLRKRKRKAQPVVQQDAPPSLNDEQRRAAEAIAAQQGFRTLLLHGVTGSGKTEVYLHAANAVLAAGRQVLFLVPEINLTPQFEQSLRARLAPVVGEDGLAILHSGLAEGERLDAWLRATEGKARILLGTRLSIFTPLPELGLIIVDEEHDTSYKQQEGLRYSARDLAVWRGYDAGVPVVLGSATPSLESWFRANNGSYDLLRLTKRARDVSLPGIRLVDTRRLQLQDGFSPHLLTAIGECLARKEQALVFLNRRGYAPVLRCNSCGWVSQCPRCTAHTVLHRGKGYRNFLQCHHCGYQAPVPRACPSCGDQDLKPMGRGTQRVEEVLGEYFQGARIARIDADSTRRKGSAAELFAQVHAGEVDILVGTQMVAKGHDFSRLGLVGVLNADSMLFAQDFRAPERLFAQLMQVSGRAGRHAGQGQVILQTDYPEQPVYQALLRHDYEGFARHTLQEREETGLPPYAHQALLTAEARELSAALAFLAQAGAQEGMPCADRVTLYDPVPLRVVRVANVERAQLLAESVERPALQAFLAAWSERLHAVGREHKVRWHLEVDPLEI